MTVKKQQDKTKIVQVWGEILDEGFTSVPNILLRYRTNLGIKSHHLALIIDIMSFKWDSENPFPSYSTLAQRANVTERGIRKIIHELEELKLLIRTPRFDEETGAQITTVFDFRPLVQKLTQEMKEVRTGDTSNLANATTRGEELQFRGGEELQFRGRVKNSSGGGRNYSSPKEYSYRRRNIYVSTPYTESGNLRSKERTNNESEDTKIEEDAKERVHTYFRNGIFRKRLFEIYDNLHDIKPIEELVEEGAYKACKEIMVNRAVDLSSSNRRINPDRIAEQVKLEFPYRKVPKKHDRARSFFIATVCNLTAKEIVSFLDK